MIVFLHMGGGKNKGSAIELCKNITNFANIKICIKNEY